MPNEEAKAPVPLQRVPTATFTPQEDDDDLIATLNPQSTKPKNPGKIKHIFEIKVNELKNIPILSKILRELERKERDDEGRPMNGKYIQTVYIKYTFPLDDSSFESDYLTYPQSEDAKFDYGVQLDSYHSYMMNKEDKIEPMLERVGQSFNIQLCCLKDNLEITLGNASMPLEDLYDLIHEFERE